MLSSCSASQMLGRALIFGLSLFTASLHAAPKEIFAPIEKLFIASGFDDNDNVEISVYGNFSDTCYRVGPTGYNVDLANHKIQIWAKAYDYSSRELACLDVLTPFLLKVSIGVLPEGEYSVEIVGQNVSEKLTISKSTTDSPDEFLYAPVTHTQIRNIENGQQELILSGEFSRLYKGCMRIKEVRSKRTSGNVLVVLPIAEIIEDETQCKDASLHFEAKLSFPSFQEIGLLHVRVSNGNSQTQLISIP